MILSIKSLTRQSLRLYLLVIFSNVNSAFTWFKKIKATGIPRPNICLIPSNISKRTNRAAFNREEKDLIHHFNQSKNTQTTL